MRAAPPNPRAAAWPNKPLCRFSSGLLALALLAAASGDPGRLRLADQFGGEDSLANHRGEVVVLILVSVRKLSSIRRWQQGLAEAHPGASFLRVADVPDDPPADPERVAAMLRKRVPAEVPVLMDFERSWAKSLALDTTQPNVLLFARDGSLAARYRGRWNPELGAAAAARLGELLAGS